MKRLFLILTAIVVTASMLAAVPAAFSLTADIDDTDTAFLTELIKGNEPEPRYKFGGTTVSDIKPDTGYDDTLKMYMLTGNSTSSFTSGKQDFENGRYKSGKFECDYSSLAHYVDTAIGIYTKTENELNAAEISRARSLIGFAFGMLPLDCRICVNNAPLWLAGYTHNDVTGITYAEKCTLTSKGLKDQLAAKPSDTTRFTSCSRKIRNDKEAFDHYLLLSPAESGAYLKIKAPSGALSFSCVISLDSAYAGKYAGDHSGNYVDVYTVSSSGSETIKGRYYVYPGYENRIDINVGKDAYVTLKFSDAAADDRFIILGDAAFLTGSDTARYYLDESAAKTPGDINGDTVINESDIFALRDRLTGRINVKEAACDVNFDGRVDHADLSVLQNYITFLINVNKITSAENPSLRVIAVGDSIARGYGIDNYGGNGTSKDAYGAQIADQLRVLTKYDIDFTNYGNDGDRINDLSDKIKSGFRRINADQKLDEAVKDADLIIVSIGGNDLLAALRDAVNKELGLNVTDLENGLGQIGNIDYQKFLDVMANEKISKDIQATVGNFTSEIKALTDQIFALNPDAKVALTTIPVAITNTNIKYRISMGAFGSWDTKLFNLYELGQKWIGYYNGVILDRFGGYDEPGLIIVDSNARFDSSNDLCLMSAPSDIVINDSNTGGLSQVHFDIHPSKKGHTVMAEAHTEALDETVRDFNANYKIKTPLFDQYTYDVDSGDPSMKIKTSADFDPSKKTVKYTAKITNLKNVKNLRIKLTCNEPLTVVSSDISGSKSAVYYAEDRSFTVLLGEYGSVPESVTLNVTFDVSGITGKETQIELTVEEALNTVTGTKVYNASDKAAVLLEEEKTPETAPAQTASEPVTDKPLTDKPETDKPQTDKPSTDKPETDKTTTDKPVTDDPGSDSSGTDVPDTGAPDTGAPGTDPETTQDAVTLPATKDYNGTETEPVTAKDPVVIDNSKNDQVVYIVLAAAGAVLFAAAVITAISLKKSKTNKDK